jgi:uncharacterized protein (DUF111 family)
MSHKERSILDRETVEIDTEFGSIRCKVGKLNGMILKYSPEYEDCRAASLQYGKPIADIYNEAISMVRSKLSVNSAN